MITNILFDYNIRDISFFYLTNVNLIILIKNMVYCI